MRTAVVAAASRRARTRTAAADIARLARRSAATKAVGFDSYREDPEGFQRDVLGYSPVEPQVEVFEAIRDHDRVAVPSGRAMGKSRLDAGAALWFAATHPNACVILIAPTFRQIQVILWEELRALYYNAKIPLGGECAKLANTGLRLPNGSRIFGITGDQPEAIQGIRAPHMMVLVDEGSGVADAIFIALEGNLAGGGKMVITGNPTRSTGYFRESCRNPRFRTVHLPSTRSPNVIAGEVVVPGLATCEWVEERKREWGDDSPMYKIHVLGQFVELAEGRLFSVDMVTAAQKLWHEQEAEGVLVIGLDPAGESGDGDESVWAPRRGNKVLELYPKRGLSSEGHVVETVGMIRKLDGVKRKPSSHRPIVVIDRDGYVGAKVFAAHAAYLEKHPDAFILRGVRGGERAKRRPKEIDRVRDEVWFALFDAFRNGLAIPEDVKLEAELAAIRIERHVSGRSKIVGKKELRSELGRSPDRGDAVALSTFVDATDDDEDGDDRARKALAPDPYDAGTETVLDPYAALDRWRGHAKRRIAATRRGGHDAEADRGADRCEPYHRRNVGLRGARTGGGESEGAPRSVRDPSLRMAA